MTEVDLYYSPYCPRCGPSRAAIREIATAMPGIRFSEFNVLEHIETAAARGVRVCPAVVVDGCVVMSGNFSLRKLRTRLRRDITQGEALR